MDLNLDCAFSSLPSPSSALQHSSVHFSEVVKIIEETRGSSLNFGNQVSLFEERDKFKRKM